MAPLPCVVITFPSSSRMISVGMPGEVGGRRTEKWKGEGGRGEDDDGEGGERWIEGGWRGEEKEGEGEGEQQRRMEGGGGEEDGGGRGCTCNRKC